MSDTQSDFLRNFSAAQQPLFAFIRASGFSLVDSEDILQDVSVVLWERYDTYDASRPFLGWAIGVARNAIRNQFRSRRVREKVLVNTEVVEQIAQRVGESLAEIEAELAEEKALMEKCIEALPDRSRSLFNLRYRDALSLDVVARQIDRSYAATNMLLTRIRSKLLDCVGGSLEGART